MNNFVSYVNAGRNTYGVTFEIDDSVSSVLNVTSVIAPPTTVSSASTSSPYISSGTGFQGTFDGNGKTINETISTSASGTGLFGYLAPTGVIEDLNVTGSVTVSGSKDAIGGVVGYNEGTISNVNSSMTVTASSAYNVGGIAGFNNKYYDHSGNAASSGSLTAVIEDCSNSGSVSSTSKTGGIVGENAGTIERCYNTGAISNTGSGKSGVGGIAGRNGNNNTKKEVGTITDCYNTGSISGSNGRWGGGIAGFNSEDCTISYCYNVGYLTNFYDDYQHIAGWNEGTVNYGFGLDTISTHASKNRGADGAILVTNDQFKGTDPYPADSSTTVLYYLNRQSNTGNWSQTGGSDTYPFIGTINFTIVKASNPGTLTYTAGDTFSTSGLSIYADYGDNNHDAITDYTVGNTNALTTSDTSISVYGTYKGVPYLYTFSITVSPAVTYSIVKASDPDRVSYAEGETFSTSGLVINRVSSTGTTTQITDYTVSNTNALTTSDSSVVISGTDSVSNLPYSFTIDITVSAVSMTVGSDTSTYYSSLANAVTAAKDGTTAAERTIYVYSTVPVLSDVDGGTAGVTIQRVSGYTGILLTVGDGASVTLQNLTISGGNSSLSSSGIVGSNLIRTYGGSLNLTSTVQLKDSYINASGGALHVQGGTVSSAATISNCYARNGGGVTASGGTFTMTNGSISGCSALNSGGGVYVTSNGDFTLSGGAIGGTGTGNSAASGGGVYNIGTFTMSGGTISDNSATNGSGVYVADGSAFNYAGSGIASGQVVYLNNTSGNSDAFITLTGAPSAITVQCANPTINSTKVAEAGSDYHDNFAYVGNAYHFNGSYNWATSNYDIILIA